jgi:hypothetical protein
MTDSSAGTGGQPPASSILGPAVPTRDPAREASAALDGSIGPFVPSRAGGEAAPEAVVIPAAREAEVIPAAPEEPVSEDTPWSHGWDEPAAQERGEDGADGEASPFDDSGSHQPSAEVLEAIAARLEGIARALRSRSGDDFGGDAGDPLEVLITGYALGYSDALRQGGRGEA